MLITKENKYLEGLVETWQKIVDYAMTIKGIMNYISLCYMMYSFFTYQYNAFMYYPIGTLICK